MKQHPAHKGEGSRDDIVGNSGTGYLALKPAAWMEQRFPWQLKSDGTHLLGLF